MTSIVIVGGGKYWRPGALHIETALGQRPVFRTIEFVSPISGCPVGLSFIGWPGADEVLLDLAVTVSRHCGRQG